MKSQYDIIVVGAGPAGLAVALSAKKNGANSVLLLDRNCEPGGILNQCIHNGFGLHYLSKEYTGPEYSEYFANQVYQNKIDILCDTMVLSISKNKEIMIVNPEHGYAKLKAKAVVLCMGCRERTRANIGVQGSRPAGVFTAGLAQLYVNVAGFQIGKRAVIIGSGDIGLIMARRLTLEGTKVVGVYEIMPSPNGLARNIVQCLDDYNIPLHLSKTITDIRGDKRVEQVIVQKVDERLQFIEGTKEVIDVDTVLFSVGLVPENELSVQCGIEIDSRTNGIVVNENMETSVPGIFACGNVVHVHDLVDFVTLEGQLAGKAAAKYAITANHKEKISLKTMNIVNGFGISYTVPQKIRIDNLNENESVDISFRVKRNFCNKQVQVLNGENLVLSFDMDFLSPPKMEKITLSKALLTNLDSNELTISVNLPDKEKASSNSILKKIEAENSGVVELVCVICPKGCHLKVDKNKEFSVTGNACPRGAVYGENEIRNPSRIITSTVRVKNSKVCRLPVKTDKNISVSKIFEAVRLLDNIVVEAPVAKGDIIVKNILKTDVNFVASRSLKDGLK